MMVKGRPKEDPDESELRRSLRFRLTLALWASVEERRSAISLSVHRRLNTGVIPGWLAGCALGPTTLPGRHTPAWRHVPSTSGEPRIQRPLRCGCVHLATARGIHRGGRLVSVATFRTVVLGFVGASRPLSREGVCEGRVDGFTTGSTGRSKAKTRQLVLRETSFAHKEYKKHFQLILISISDLSFVLQGRPRTTLQI